MPTRRPSRRATRRSLLASFLLHLTAILVLAALLQPAGFGPKRPLELELSTVEPLPEPELLVVSQAPLPTNAGELLSNDQSDVFAAAGEFTAYFSPDRMLSGGRKQALAIYRRIERDYPSSDAAKTAITKTTELSANE